MFALSNADEPESPVGIRPQLALARAGVQQDLGLFNRPPTLVPNDPLQRRHRFLRLRGNRWSGKEE
jgi:hypothetical protein